MNELIAILHKPEIQYNFFCFILPALVIVLLARGRWNDDNIDEAGELGRAPKDSITWSEWTEAQKNKSQPMDW